MSKTFENLITLTQIRDGAPGATGAPGASTSTKFIYCVSDSENIDSLPTLPERGQTNSFWKETPHGVSQTNRYEFVSSASSQSVNGEIEWGEYSTPALWSKWAQDGTGVEIKGLAYIDLEGEPVPGSKYFLYTDQEFTQQIIEAQNGDSYLAEGYLFVYNEEDGNYFSCVGKIQGPDGKDGVDGKDGKDGVDGKDGKDGENGKDGKDANTVLIVTNTDKINRFYQNDKFVLSPEIIKFTLYNNPYIEGTSKPIDFSGNYQLGYFDSSDNFISFDEINSYVSFGIEQEFVDDEGNIDKQKLDENTLFLRLQDYVNEQNPDVFKIEDLHLLSVFRYIKDNEVLGSKVLPIENGVTPDMAKFNVTAANINASVGNSKMVFTTNGLEINNGDFKITQSKQQVFGFETENIGGQDVSRLTVRGTVYADNGRFTGEIRATNATFEKGEIGGFKIEDERLTSVATISENDIEVPAIELNGKSGNIIARNIELGNNATVSNQIKFGKTVSAYLRNPDTNNGQFITSGDIVIKNDGTAKFGSISVDGSNSEISGSNWKIGNDYASFSNVNVSGSIETAVFKTNSVQAAGGAMIFRPSYKGSLKNEQGAFVVYLESTYEGAIGNIIQVVFDGNDQEYFGKVASCIENKLSIDWDDEPNRSMDSIVLIDYGNLDLTKPAYNYPLSGENYYDEDGKSVTLTEKYSKFSTNGEYLSSKNLSADDDVLKGANQFVIENEILINSIRNFYVKENDILIGINSGRTHVGLNDKILPRGLTLTSLDTSEAKKPKLYLGDLREVGFEGYGLYADNVYLKGSLTTELIKNEQETLKATYTGINTLNETRASVFENDTSRIVIWAGATDVSDIWDAPFQVTEEGSVYAQRARLEDTLLVGGTIEAAKIHTAELHGKEGSLSIYDDADGIKFKKTGENNSEQDIFSIDINGLTANKINFVNIGDKITILGDSIRTSNNNNYLSLETINGDKGYLAPALKHYDVKNNNNCGFYFEDTQTSFKMNESVIQTWTPRGVATQGDFEIGQGNYKMQYKKEDNGYNLYIVTE